MICKFIEEATKEFEQNGRSARFVAMENKIISKRNPVQVYFFARYAKGADVARLQRVLIENAPLDVCWFFQLNVEGSDIDAFIDKAVYEVDNFWISKFVRLKEKTKNKQQEQLEEIEDEDFEQPRKKTPGPKKYKNRDVKPDMLIESSNKEYARFGRSTRFANYERDALYISGLGGDQLLYMKNVEGADITAFERVALLRGSAFNMYLMAKEIPGVDKNLMLQGIKLAKLDYVAIEKDRNAIKATVDNINKQIQKAKDAGDEVAVKRFKEYLRQKQAGWCYLDHVKMYEAEVEGMVLKERKR